jgi:hypothetical protein
MRYSDPSDIDWQACWIISPATAAGTFFGLTFLHKRRESTTFWTKPSWFQNPFQPRSQPLQLWDLGALTEVAGGLGGVINTLSTGQYSRMPEPCLYLLMGLGIWISMGIWLMVFHIERGQPD